MMQIELTCISIKCEIVNPCIDGFFNSYGNAIVSLPIIWKLSCVVVWPMMKLWLFMGGSIRCSLNLFPKALEVSPIYSSPYTSYPHFNTQGLKINGHAQGTPSIGHAQSTQPNTTMHIFTGLWSMLREHHCLSMCIEPPRTHIICWISFLPQTWWSPTVGWKKASFISTIVLFQKINQLLDNTTEWEI